MLSEHGVTSQTVSEAQPVRILPARCLSRIYSQKGRYLGYRSRKTNLKLIISKFAIIFLKYI